MSRIAAILVAWLLTACASLGITEVLVLQPLFVCGVDPYWFEHSRGQTIKVPRASPAKSVLYAPKPQYPYEARLNLWEDTLLVELHLRPDGTVTRVEFPKHSRYYLLDYCAKEAFRQWRFRPGTPERVRIPVTFSLHCPEWPNTPNQALERTADRREDLLSMTSKLKLEAALAVVSGPSACSR